MLIQAAIMEISLKDLFDMELWQFVCYMEGNRQKKIYKYIDDVILATRIGQYTGQYFTGKKAPDANNIIDKLYAEIEKRSIDEEESDKEAQEKINKLKENLKYFN